MRIKNTQLVTQTKRILEFFTGANPFVWGARGMYLGLGNMVNHSFVEVSGGNYKRYKLADTWLYPSESVFDNKLTEGVIRNTEPIYFPSATASWGTITSWAIFDARGVIWWIGEFTNSITVNANQTVVINAGQIKFTLESEAEPVITINLTTPSGTTSVTCTGAESIGGSDTTWTILAYTKQTYTITATDGTNTGTTTVAATAWTTYTATITY